MNLITRDKAKKEGLKYYFTGKSCKHGHTDRRFVSSKGCVQCQSNLRCKYRITRKKELTLYHKEWRVANKEHTTTVSALYHQNNKEKINRRKKEYYKNNKKLWLAKKTKRKLSKERAVPKWANLEAIKLIYINCPAGMQVDHVLPLQGSLICGLHVENNLQYLTETENKRKANKFKPFIELCQVN